MPYASPTVDVSPPIDTPAPPAKNPCVDGVYSGFAQFSNLTENPFVFAAQIDIISTANPNGANVVPIDVKLAQISPMVSPISPAVAAANSNATDVVSPSPTDLDPAPQWNALSMSSPLLPQTIAPMPQFQFLTLQTMPPLVSPKYSNSVTPISTPQHSNSREDDDDVAEEDKGTDATTVLRLSSVGIAGVSIFTVLTEEIRELKIAKEEEERIMKEAIERISLAVNTRIGCSQL